MVHVSMLVIRMAMIVMEVRIMLSLPWQRLREAMLHLVAIPSIVMVMATITKNDMDFRLIYRRHILMYHYGPLRIVLDLIQRQ